jgi:hypothetical protein
LAAGHTLTTGGLVAHPDNARGASKQVSHLLFEGFNFRGVGSILLLRIGGVGAFFLSDQ